MLPATVGNGASLVDILIPAWAKADWSESTSSSSASEPVVYSKASVSLAPEATPAPHSFDPEPGRVHVSVPPGTTFQPCCFSRLTASIGLYGYGFSVSCRETKALAGCCGTGP